jgi:hypothetical protein
LLRQKISIKQRYREQKKKKKTGRQDQALAQSGREDFLICDNLTKF